MTNMKTAIGGMATPPVLEKASDAEADLSISMDDGQTWQPSTGFKIKYKDAAERDGEESDLIVSITEGDLQLELHGQSSGKVLRAACLKFHDFVDIAGY